MWQTLPNLQTIMLFSGSALLAATLALFVLSRLLPPVRTNARSILGSADEKTVFIFDDDILLDATPQARRLLTSAPHGHSEIERLLSLLIPSYPGLADRYRRIDDLTQIELLSTDGASRLRVDTQLGLIRISVLETETDEGTVSLDRHGLSAMERELETLRATTNKTPFLVWRQTREGVVTWANKAYLDMVNRLSEGSESAVWPPPALFDPVLLSQAHDSGASRRIALRETLSRTPSWFECYSAPIGAEILFTAVDTNAAVMAETQLRDFMQTLTKTFAHLTIGLAIFDRSRRLALFNPALTDLTTLPIDFLTGRPTLLSFLDRLRDKRVIPEPKDYKTWRRQMADLEAAAADGSYAETWSLPTGQTYRVTGRPHPDGAVAFLFEDISAEISLTRRFRIELEMGQSVMDSMDEALVVFASNGTLAMSNAAYADLWGVDPSTSLNELSVTEATRAWSNLAVPSPIWGDLRDFTRHNRERSDWSEEVRLRDGRALMCRVAPLAGGATLVGFSVIPSSLPLKTLVAREA